MTSGSATAQGLTDLLRSAAARTPGRTAVVAGDERCTFAELDRAVSSTAAALLADGASPGDRIALRLPTGVDFVRVYLGALRAGLVCVPVNPAYTDAEAEHIASDAGVVRTVDAQHPVAATDGASDPGRDGTGEDLAVLLYTSGTSGRPKGAMLTVRALLANLDQLAGVEPALLTGADVLFVPLPLTHVFGLNAGLGMALRVGATLVLADRFDPDDSLATIAREGVTAVLGVPGQFASWLRRPDVGSAFAGVRFAMSGSTTLTRAVLEGYRALGVVLHDGYGLTEAAPVVSITALGARDVPHPGSIGRPLPGVEVQLRDHDDEPVEDGDPGRIFVRGANLFSGYWPDGADGPDADGWFGTGDVAVFDGDGELHLVGRSTDLVIVNGFNVYPAEVEAVFAADPDVAEVAVTGVPDETTGERVVAFVVPVAGRRLDVERLLEAAAQRLARFKLPATVDVVDRLPHTVTGKIMKWQLAATD